MKKLYLFDFDGTLTYHDTCLLYTSGADSVANKANQAKMPEEFDMYMKSKEIFTKKSVEAKQGYETYKRIQDMIPTMVGMLNGQNLTPEVVAALRPTTQDQACLLYTSRCV